MMTLIALAMIAGPLMLLVAGLETAWNRRVNAVERAISAFQPHSGDDA